MAHPARAALAARLGVAPSALARALARGGLDPDDPAALAALLADLGPAEAGASASGRATPDEIVAAPPDPDAPAAMSDEVTVSVPMDYPGKVISVNHCYRQGAGGRRYLRREAGRWRRDLTTALRYALLDAGVRAALCGPVTVRIDAHYTDRNHGVDPDNLNKLTFDAAKVALGVDDRDFQPARGTVTYGAVIPALTITVTAHRADNTPPGRRAGRRAHRGDDGA